eukprot:COSAG02_NODE_1676_length_11364_cov_12.500755_7_plen_65_part_00
MYTRASGTGARGRAHMASMHALRYIRIRGAGVELYVAPAQVARRLCSFEVSPIRIRGDERRGGD